MYGFLGWLNVLLLAAMTAPYWLRWINKRTFQFKGGLYGKTIQYLRKIHKPLGFAILIIGLIHGYLALGGFRLHTGSVLLVTLVLVALFGLLFHFRKDKKFFKWHKRIVVIAGFALAVHLLFPNAIYYLLN
ncbi:MAG: hypothetical protein PWQ12_693 [Clostridiales bacterium]|jgi:hypothetical protein|nr:hypothetical protein [Clostridiales bacterium]